MKKKISAAIFAVISFFLMLLEFPIFQGYPWLKYDPSDIPALITGFKFVPAYGFAVILIRNILFYMYKGDAYGYIGFAASLLAGIAFISGATFFYYRKKTRKSAIKGLIIGTLLMSLIMVPTNYVIVKYIYIVENINILSYILYAIVPFNILKGLVNSIIVLFIYKKIGSFLEQDEK